MVSSELVVLLIVCVGINTGSAQQDQPSEIVTHSHQLQLNHCTLSTAPCQDETVCHFNSAFDTNTNDCMSTTLNCVDSYCEAVINTVSRNCEFMNIGANVSQTIYCCPCFKANATDPLNLLWGLQYNHTLTVPVTIK